MTASTGEVDGLRRTLIRYGLAIVGTMIVQTFVIGYWAGTTAARLGHCESGLLNVNQRVHALEVKPHDR